MSITLKENNMFNNKNEVVETKENEVVETKENEEVSMELNIEELEQRLEMSACTRCCVALN